MSETICLVVDSAELCRHVHCNDKFLEASESIFQQLSEFISKLNTTVELYDSLLGTMEAGKWEDLTFEEKMVATQLKTEFELHGIQKGQEERNYVVELQNRIASYGQDFLTKRVDAKTSTIYVPLGSVTDDVPNRLRKTMKRSVLHPTMIAIPALEEWLKYLDDPSSRKKVFESLHSLPDNVYLQRLLSARHELAQFVNFPSYAHHILKTRVCFLSHHFFKLF